MDPTTSKLLDQIRQHCLSITKQHPGVVEGVELVVDPAKPGFLLRFTASTVFALSASMIGMP
jgi:hypothetical protein